jgi:hypothetical protein
MTRVAVVTRMRQGDDYDAAWQLSRQDEFFFLKKIYPRVLSLHCGGLG